MKGGGRRRAVNRRSGWRAEEMSILGKEEGAKPGQQRRPGWFASGGRSGHVPERMAREAMPWCRWRRRSRPWDAKRAGIGAVNPHRFRNPAFEQGMAARGNTEPDSNRMTPSRPGPAGRRSRSSVSRAGLSEGTSRLPLQRGGGGLFRPCSMERGGPILASFRLPCSRVFRGSAELGSLQKRQPDIRGC